MCWIINYDKLKERVDILNQLGFVFKTSPSVTRTSSFDRAWQQMYEQLIDYHKKHRHTNVPSNTSLGQWCVRQRYLYRLTGDQSLCKERVKKLNSLGFQWQTRYEVLWDKRVEELREFKEQHGHCMVPRRVTIQFYSICVQCSWVLIYNCRDFISRNYPPNMQLSSWVATQRKYYNLKQNGKPSYLTNERQKQLEEMDFVWSYWDAKWLRKEFNWQWFSEKICGFCLSQSLETTFSLS